MTAGDFVFSLMSPMQRVDYIVLRLSGTLSACFILHEVHLWACIVNRAVSFEAMHPVVVDRLGIW